MNTRIDQLERNKTSTRTKVKHLFRVLKQQFGCAKVRYRGPNKNTTQIANRFAIFNLRTAWHKLPSPHGTSARAGDAEPQMSRHGRPVSDTLGRLGAKLLKAKTVLVHSSLRNGQNRITTRTPSLLPAIENHMDHLAEINLRTF